MSSITIFAQRGMSHEDRMKNLDERLNLSEEQYTQVDSILKDQTKEFQILREGWDEGGDRDEMRQKMRELRNDTDDKILAVLNEEQTTEYKKYQEERAQRRRDRQSNN
jgi:protein CpxP